MTRNEDHERYSRWDYSEWRRKYSVFPGIAECVKLLGQRNKGGEWIEIIEWEMTVHAKECLPELAAVFNSEKSDWVRMIVLYAITEAKLPEAIEFLAEVVNQGDPKFAPIAQKGLSMIDTRESRTALWKATHDSQ